MKQTIALLCACVVGSVTILGCARTEAALLGAPTAQEAARSRELLFARFAAMAKTIEAGDAAGFVSFYVDAPVHLPPGAPRNTSQAEIASFLEGKLGIYEIDEPPTIVFSDDASLAYVYGEYRIEENPEKGIEAVNGRFVTIWQRDGDTWKCAVDIWNSSDAKFAHH
jgi:ketosteroid isomerase-like protein